MRVIFFSACTVRFELSTPPPPPLSCCCSRALLLAARRFALLALLELVLPAALLLPSRKLPEALAYSDEPPVLETLPAPELPTLEKESTLVTLAVEREPVFLPPSANASRSSREPRPELRSPSDVPRGVIVIARSWPPATCAATASPLLLPL